MKIKQDDPSILTNVISEFGVEVKCVSMGKKFQLTTAKIVSTFLPLSPSPMMSPAFRKIQGLCTLKCPPQKD